MVNKRKVIITSLIALTICSNLYASDIYYRGEYIVSNRFSIKPAFNTGEGKLVISNRFSIKPAFNTGEGKLVISNRFSIKPAFNTGKTQYFYSGALSIMEMPDAIFMADGIQISNKTKVKDTSKLSFSIDYGSTPYTTIKCINYFINNITDNVTYKSSDITIVNNSVNTLIDNKLERGKKYEIGQITTFNDGFSYETKSVPFIVNEKGIIEFLNTKDNILFNSNLTLSFEIKNSQNVNSYNVYLEYADGSRELVGNKVSVTDTFVNNTEDGYSVHQFKHNFNNTGKKFKYVIQIID